MEDKASYFNRRKLLKNVALAGIGGALVPLTSFDCSGQSKKGGLIEEENSKKGTIDWQLAYVRTRDFRSELIEGYCSKTSVKAGDSIDIFVSVYPDSNVSIDIFRIGYYGGKGGRFITRLGPFPVELQPTPPVGEHRLRECQWQRTTELKIPGEWVSGVYLGKLSCDAHRYESYIIFVVRDNRKADILFQTSDTTWQAYNKWPDEYSLYDSDPPKRAWSSSPWVSYDRPYGKCPQVVDQPLTQGSGEFLAWEYPLCYWLEQNGYNVTYCSNIDTHTKDAELERIKCFLSVGHDEYWSLEMYEYVSAAIKNGLSVGFLGGDTVVGTIPLNQLNYKGQPHRILRRTGLFCGKDAENLEAYLGSSKGWAHDLITEHFDNHGPSQAMLVGGRTSYPGNGSGDWIVKNEKHWIFEGTGLKNGDAFRGLVGWEYQSFPPDNVPGLEVIAEGNVMRIDGSKSPYAATVYPGPKDNWVFNASTIYWSLGLIQPPGINYPYAHLGRPVGPDERVQKIMTNFLNK